MIIKRINLNEFIEEFKHYNRDYFSDEGYEALFEYLEGLSEDIGEPIELDVIAIVCEFTEYTSIDEFNDDYSYTIGNDIDSIDDIGYYTTVIEFDGGFIIQVF